MPVRLPRRPFTAFFSTVFLLPCAVHPPAGVAAEPPHVLIVYASWTNHTRTLGEELLLAWLLRFKQALSRNELPGDVVGAYKAIVTRAEQTTFINSILQKDPQGRSWTFQLANPTIMEKVQHYRDEVAKTKSKAFGRLYMQNMYGGAEKLAEAVETGEVKVVYGDDGTELFQMTSYEIHKNQGKRSMGGASASSKMKKTEYEDMVAVLQSLGWAFQMNAKQKQDIKAGAQDFGADVRLLPVQEASFKRDVLEWADAVLIGSPVHYGNVASALLAWVEADWTSGWQDPRLTDKVGGVFATGGGLHQGVEHVLVSLNRLLWSFRFHVVTPPPADSGYLSYGVAAVTGTPPFNTSGPTIPPGYADAAREYGKLIAEEAARRRPVFSKEASAVVTELV